MMPWRGLPAHPILMGKIGSRALELSYKKVILEQVTVVQNKVARKCWDIDHSDTNT
jgi:hypothetical protein